MSLLMTATAWGNNCACGFITGSVRASSLVRERLLAGYITDNFPGLSRSGPRVLECVHLALDRIYLSLNLLLFAMYVVQL